MSVEFKIKILEIDTHMYPKGFGRLILCIKKITSHKSAVGDPPPINAYTIKVQKNPFMLIVTLFKFCVMRYSPSINCRGEGQTPDFGKIAPLFQTKFSHFHAYFPLLFFC